MRPTSRRLYGSDAVGFFKDGINDRVVAGDHGAVNPAHQGTKCAAWVRLRVEAGAETVLRLRFSPAEAGDSRRGRLRGVFATRIREADAFYAAVQADIADPDARLVQRQAFAGMLWSKQFYHFDVARWLKGDPAQPAPPRERRHGRDSDWQHLVNADIVSMPDKWEYPWYAAWDLAFHCSVFALIDPDFAKASSSCSPANGTCSRTASCPPTSGTSATSIRPSTASRPGVSTRWTGP